MFCEVPALAVAGADHSLISSLSHLDRWNLRKAPREHTVYQNDLLSGLGPKTHPDLSEGLEQQVAKHAQSSILSVWEFCHAQFKRQVVSSQIPTGGLEGNTG